MGRNSNSIARPKRGSEVAADAVLVVALLLVGAGIYVVGLGTTVLASADEGLYASVARHMLRDGRWLVPRLYWGGEFGPYMDKPPLMFWLQSASMAVFGVNEFAVRFPSAAFSVLTGVLIYAFGRDLSDRRTGFLAGLVFLTTPHLYAGGNAGRTGALDAGHVFLGTLLVLCIWKAARTGRDRWVWRAAFVVVPLVLTKGFASIAFLVVLVPLVVRRRRVFVRRSAAAAATTAVALASIWPAYMWGRYGSRFVHDIFVDQVLRRLVAEIDAGTALGVLSDLSRPFLVGFPLYFDPWAWFLLPAIPVAVVPAERGRIADRTAAAFLLWWSAGVFICFGLAEHAWYMLPIYVPCSLLVGRLLSRAVEGDPIAIVSVATAASFAVLFSPQASVLSPIALDGRMSALYPVRPRWEYVGAVVAGAGAVGTAARLTRWTDRRFHAVRSGVVGYTLPALVAVLLVAALVGPATIDGRGPERQQRSLSMAANERVPAGATIHLRADGARSPLRVFEFYVRRPIRRTAVERLGDGSVRYALVTERTAATIDRNYTVLAASRSETLSLRLVELEQGDPRSRARSRSPGRRNGSPRCHSIRPITRRTGAHPSPA